MFGFFLCLAFFPLATLGQVTLTLGSGSSGNWCDTLTVTSKFTNVGSTLDGLWITNQLPAGMYYVTNQTTITMPNGQVVTGSSAEPVISGGTNLVWDFSDAASDSGISHLLISEVMYDPSGDANYEDTNEWFEIYNPTANDILMEGYSILDAIPSQSDNLPTATVPAGGYVIVAACTNAFRILYPDYAGTVIEVDDKTLGSGLNNFADGLFLRNASAVTVDAVSYGGSSAAFSPGVTAVSEGQSIVRNPVNADNNRAADWVAGNPPTPGSGYVLAGISQNGSVTVVYRIELGCAAASANLRASAGFLQPAGGAAGSASTTYALSVLGSHLNVFKRPILQSAAYGETVVWTVRVENVGFGVARNVDVIDTRGPGIRFTGFSETPTNSAPYGSLTTVVWSASTVPALAELEPGESVSIVVTAQIDSCEGLYNTVGAQSRCTGMSSAPESTCFDTTLGGSEGASIEFNYRYASLSGAVNPPDLLTLTACDGGAFTLYLTNAAGADVGTALNLQLVPSLPAGYSLSGAAYNAGLNRIVVGDLAPGSTTNITLDLVAGGSCPLDHSQQESTFQALYTDVCGLSYEYPTLNLRSVLGEDPAASVTKTMPSSISGAASSLTVTVYYTYENFDNTAVTIVDQMPANAYFTLTDIIGGGSASGNTNVSWNLNLSGSGVFTGSFKVGWTDSCGVAGTRANTIVASNIVDCLGCTYPVAGSGESYLFTITATHCNTNESDSTGTCSFAMSSAVPSVAEVCEPLTLTTRVSNLTYSTNENWNGVLFTNNFFGGQGVLLSTNSIRVSIHGDDYTSDVHISTGATWRVSFTNLALTSISRPGLMTGAMDIVWSVMVTNAGQAIDRSGFTLPGCSTRTDNRSISVGYGMLDVSLNALEGRDACGVARGSIDLTQYVLPELSALTNRTFPVYDVEVVLDLDVNRNGAASYSYVDDTTSLSNYYASTGAALTGIEPTVTTTQLVWSLGDLRTNGAGSVYFSLQGSCSVEASEKLNAYVRFNRRCEDGTTPRQFTSFSVTNSLPTLQNALISAQLEPEVAFLAGTTFVYRIDFFNSGAATAYNVASEVAFTDNIVFENAGLAPAVVSATNLIWTFQSVSPFGQLVDADDDGMADDLPPNKLVSIYVTNHITACLPNEVRLTVRSGCKDTYCASGTATDTATFVPSSPNLASTTTFPSNHTLCTEGPVLMQIRNSGAGNAYDVFARHVLPLGVTYVPGSAMVSIDGSATNSIPDPTGTGTTANPLEWTIAQIPSLATLAPNQYLRILYRVNVDCESVLSNQNYLAYASYRDNCGNRLTNASTVATATLQRPVLTITKASRNLTRGDVAYTTATVPGNPGDILSYRITIDHGGTSGAEAQFMEVTDILPDTLTYAGAWPVPDTVAGTTLTWNNTTLMTLAGASEYTRAASALYLYVTGVVDTCTANVQNKAGVNYGCAADCLSMSLTSTVYHTFTPSLATMVGATDGMYLSAASGNIIVTVTNSGGASSSMIITQAAPRGYVITGASIAGEYTSTSLNVTLTGSPAGQTGIVYLTTAAASGATDLNDDLDNGLDNLDLSYGDWFRITFTLRGDGSNIDCLADPTDLDWLDPAPDEPSGVSARFSYGSTDICDQTQAGANTMTTVPQVPDPDIDIQPNEVFATNGQSQVFTITMRNRGEQGNASNLAMRIYMGPGWSSLTILSTTLIQSASGTVITEQQGSSNILVSLPGVVLDPLDDKVEFSVRAVANEGAGGLDVLAEVVGDSVNASIPTCTFTNTYGWPPFANSMTGSVIGPVDGQYYAFDQDRSRVAGFSSLKTVRLAASSPPGVTNLSARIGEDLIYRIEARFFGQVFSNVVLTESLPSNLLFGTPVDAGSSPNIVGQWSYNAANGEFTLPSPISSDALFIVDIPVVVSNRLTNQGEVGNQTIFTNALSTSLDVDGITNAPPVAYTQVKLLEPVLSLTKTSSASSPVAAGDFVVFTCRVSHAVSSATNAYDLVFTDTLPSGLTFAGSDPGTDGLDNDGDGDIDEVDEATLVSGDTITITSTHFADLANLPPGETRSFVLRALVLNQSLGSTFTNIGRVTWTSMPGTPAHQNERTGVDGEAGLNNYTTTATAPVTSRSVTTLTKTLIWTSQTNTVDPDVTIGERMVYRTRVEFPSGISTNFVIVDNVSTGMDFVGTNPSEGMTYPGLGYNFYVPPGGPVFATNAAMGLVVTDPDATPTHSRTTDGSGRPITFTIGGITNTPDGNSDNDYFDLFAEFTLTTHNTNNGLASLARFTNNIVRITDTHHDLVATSENYRVVEPLIDIRKTSTVVNQLDAGDILIISLTASNRSTYTANAYDMIMTDRISNRYFDVSTITAYETAPGWTFGTVTYADYTEVRYTSDPGTALATGAKVTNSFSVTISPFAQPAWRFTNRVDISYDNLDGGCPIGTTGRVRTANSTLVFSNRNTSIAKSLVWTTETGPADSTSTNVQIGEGVHYQLRVNLTEGTVTNLAITDALPEGLGYLHGSTTVDVSTLNGTLGEIAVEPAGTGVAASGVDPVFTFTGASSITGDNDTNNNHFFIYFTAVVLDSPANTGLVAGTQTLLINNASMTFVSNPYAAPTSSNVVVQVIEPLLTLAKNIIQTNADAGDSLTVDLVVTNHGLAAAYDVQIIDPLDPLYFNAGSAAPVSIPEGFIMAVSNDTVYFRPDPGDVPTATTIDAGEVLTFRFTVAASDFIPPYGIVTNRATIQAGDSIAGTPVHEVQRSVAGPQAEDTFTSGVLGIAKRLYGTSETMPGASTNDRVQIGETVTYEIDVLLPEGTITNLVVTDRLPAGLAYVHESVVIDTAGFSGSPGTLEVTPSGSGLAASGQDIEFLFADATTITSDNNDANNTFKIRLSAVVLDVPANTGFTGNQTVLTNTAEVSFGSFAGSALSSDPVTVTVIEPDLVLTKDINRTGGDAGDVLTFTLIVTNRGLAAAYDLRIEDLLSTNVIDAATITAGSIPAGFTFAVTGDTSRTVVLASSALFTPPTNSVEAGEKLTFTFTGALAQHVEPGSILTNTARLVAADSLASTPSHEVQRSLPPLAASDTLIISNLVVTKTLLATSATGVSDTTGSALTIGETATYRLSVYLPEGTITNLTVIDAVPPGFAYVDGSLTVNDSAFSGTLPGAPGITSDGGSGDDVTILYEGLTIITADNNGANNQLDFTLTLRVLDIQANDGVNQLDGNGFTTLTNRAIARWYGPSGSSVTSAPVTSALVEPYLRVSKSVSMVNGLTNVVRIVVTNSGSVTAYDLAVEDVFFDTEWVVTSLAGSVSEGYVLSIDQQADRAVVSVVSDPVSAPPLNSLEARDFFVITVTGLFQEAFSGTAINTARVTSASTLSGEVDGERTYDDILGTAPFGAPDLVGFLRGTDENGLALVCGETILYRLVVTNVGGSAATGVKVYLPVPTNTAFVADSIRVNGSPAAGEGNPMQVSIPNLNPSTSQTVTYRVTVDCGLPLSVTSIYNRATVTWNESSRIEVADNDTSGHSSLIDDDVDDPVDFGSDTSDDDPTILPLSSIAYTVNKQRIIPAGRAASINEAVQFLITVTNTGGIPLTSVALEDRYETTYLEFRFSDPDPDDSTNDGILNWSNLGSLNPGQARSITVSFTARATTPSVRENVAEVTPAVAAPYTAPDPQTATADYEVAGTTYASVTGLERTRSTDGIMLTWETAAEVGTIGFYVWEALDGNPSRLVQPELHPAFGLPAGGRYVLADPEAAPQATSYLVEEVEDTGLRLWHGPFAVEALTKVPRTESAIISVAAPRSPMPRPLSRQTASETIDPDGRARLDVQQTGFYRIDLAELSYVMGIASTDLIARAAGDALEIRRDGVRIPWFNAPASTGLILYAQGPGTPSDACSRYVVATGRNVRLFTETLQASSATADAYRAQVHAETNRIATMSLLTDTEDDFWMWEQLIGGQSNANRKTFTLMATQPASGQACLTVRLLGGSNTTAPLDHHAKVRVNGSFVGEAIWDGRYRHALSTTFDAALLSNGVNQIEVEGLRPAGVAYTLFYVDALTLDYPRLFSAVDPVSVFSFTNGEAVVLHGWTNQQALVLDITAARAPQRVTGYEIVNSALTLPGTGIGHTYAIIQPDALAKLTPQAGHLSMNLASPSNRADYLLVYAPGLEDAAERLAAHRRAQGLIVITVKAEEIFQAFGHGKPGPGALRSMLLYAQRHWAQGPRYVLLLGAGTYDYRDVQGYHDNLIPPALISSPGGLFASDAPLADTLNGDGWPDIAIGRIAAANEAEADAAINKIIGYENTSGAWAARLVALTDNNDAGGDFTNSAARIVSLATGRFATTSIGLGTTGLAAARTAMLGAWQEGIGVLNYIGHGGLDRMAAEGLVLSSDAATLTNGYRAPLVIAMTCVMGRYSVPGYPCLAEHLLLAQAGGASAVLAPVGLSIHAADDDLNAALMQALAAGPGRRLGDLWLEAVESCRDQGTPVDMMNIYNLLGDPAQEIK